MIALSTKEVTALLPMDQAIELVERAMITSAQGGATLPLRHAMDLDGANKLGIMPGALRDPYCYGVKLISLYPDNPASGKSSHLGLMVLFEREFGTPTAIMSAEMLTAIRTAAASAVATRVLSRKDAQVLAVIGTGEQAMFHIEAMLAVRDIREVHLTGRNQKRSDEFAAAVANRYPDLTIIAIENPQEAVKGADIICTVTSSKTTVLKGAWVKAGTHVNAVGASVPSMREIDQDLVVSSTLYVDYRPSALAQASDIISAIECGAISKDHIKAEIGEVLAGIATGRQDEQEITLYRSLGIAAQDLICAHHVMTEAKANNLGIVATIT